jgi:putative oxidoreductase
MLRVGVGMVFLFAGLQKVLPGTGATVAYFTRLGIPWPDLLGPFVSYLELVGALLLILGLLTRLLSALFTSEMVVAILVERLPIATQANSVADAFSVLRLELLIIVVASSLLLMGGGRWSLDAVLRRHLAPTAPRPSHGG